jgi:valyl-tRNA synthetase
VEIYLLWRLVAAVRRIGLSQTPKAESQVNRLEKLLASSFSERAPSEIVQKERDKLSDYRKTVEKLKKQLAALE